MGLLTTYLGTGLLLIFAFLLCFLYIYSLKVYKYWEKKGVPYIKPIFPYGTMRDVLFHKKSYNEIIAESYFQLNKNKFIGFFSIFSPGLIINDLEVSKHILIKDFHTFRDLGTYSNKKKDPLSAHLIATDGPEWKVLRNRLNPCFTLNKLKNMFDIISKCEKQFQNYVARESAKSEALEWKNIFSRYGCEVFAKAAFGLETNSLVKDSSKIFDNVRQILAPSFIQGLRMTLSFYGTRFARLMNLRVFPKDVTEFYMAVFREMVHYRENNNVIRNDFLHLLMELRGEESLKNTDDNSERESKDADKPMTMHEIAAQALMFSVAGFEAPSCALIFCAYELAMNPDIQKKLHDEIDALEGEITYENLHGLEYLDMVFSETLRKYPPVGISKRTCTQDYKLPDSNLVIEKGTLVIVPILGLHMNPELFPEPEKFIPERFSKENIKNIKPFSYLPFGQGPRICIGRKFAEMLVKLSLVQLLKRFRFEVTEKTCIPPVFDPKGLLTNSKGGMWLRVVDRGL